VRHICEDLGRAAAAVGSDSPEEQAEEILRDSDERAERAEHERFDS